jgi:4-alpha-glucanotransferase
MRAGGFKLFRETLRAALAGAGGVRIDHAMGLRRLWLVPRGASAAQGAYLAYPEADLLRLIALECARAGAVAVGEDLGTVPEGFREGLRAAGVLGMSVLWFERNGERFRPAREWSPSALAMTSTHDLATVAGWWEGRDLVWRARRAGTERAPAEAEAERTRERTALWDALSAAGLAEGPPPSPQTPAAAVTGALALVADAPAPLALIPAEDLLGLQEQVNLPGDVEVHPNWRRRLEGPAARLFQTEGVAERLALLRRRRRP